MAPTSRGLLRTPKVRSRANHQMELSVQASTDKICSRCRIPRPVSDFHVRASQCKPCRTVLMRGYYGENKERINSQNIAKADATRFAVLDLLGRSCSECGESEPNFLSVDHVHNDRKLERSNSSLTWKRDIVSGTVDLSRYRVLCRNCNESRQRLNPTQLLKERVLTGVTKRCTRCDLDKDICFFSTSSYRGKRCLDSTCDLCTRFDLLIVTVKCYEMLGGKCVCCAVSNPSMLNIDHVRNDGSEKRLLGDRTGVSMCRRILRGDVPIHDYQLLCANCNYGKMRRGSCIHSLSTGVMS